jgi:hypothetical protein
LAQHLLNFRPERQGQVEFRGVFEGCSAVDGGRFTKRNFLLGGECGSGLRRGPAGAGEEGVEGFGIVARVRNLLSFGVHAVLESYGGEDLAGIDEAGHLGVYLLADDMFSLDFAELGDGSAQASQGPGAARDDSD